MSPEDRIDFIRRLQTFAQRSLPSEEGK
jgi:hypothetical protein